MPGAALQGAARDAVVARANTLEQRTQTAIDRVTRSAKGKALNEQELIVDGHFDGTIALRNYALWQIGMILYCLEELDQGFILLGGGTTRGNGRVSVALRGIRIEQSISLASGDHLVGAGEGGDPKGDRIALPSGSTARHSPLSNIWHWSTGLEAPWAQVLIRRFQTFAVQRGAA
jgi:hypothetical protein